MFRVPTMPYSALFYSATTVYCISLPLGSDAKLVCDGTCIKIWVDELRAPLCTIVVRGVTVYSVREVIVLGVREVSVYSVCEVIVYGVREVTVYICL
jgi:hypothetical protein